MSMQTLPVAYGDQPFDIIIIGGERWAMGNQVGSALGFSFATKSINSLYKRNRLEFGIDDTMVVEIKDRMGRDQLTRLYSEKGVAKLAMFAATPKAAAFRDWAAMMLTSPAPAPVAALPAPPAPKLPIEVRRALTRHYGLTKMVRYTKMGLNGVEIGQLLKLSKNAVRVRRRLAERFGLIEPSPYLSRQRELAVANGVTRHDR